MLLLHQVVIAREVPAALARLAVHRGETVAEHIVRGVKVPLAFATRPPRLDPEVGRLLEFVPLVLQVRVVILCGPLLLPVETPGPKGSVGHHLPRLALLGDRAILGLFGEGVRRIVAGVRAVASCCWAAAGRFALAAREHVLHVEDPTYEVLGLDGGNRRAVCLPDRVADGQSTVLQHLLVERIQLLEGPHSEHLAVDLDLPSRRGGRMGEAREELV
mmetsp:Transcript_89273/g.237283  ORF Transcript_89273/g.237283 Transcript_89273/m.237283 type:complete len:217 (+) Transcript_89273:420-1070(+)